jgi:hypothetical protein
LLLFPCGDNHTQNNYSTSSSVSSSSVYRKAAHNWPSVVG